MKRFLEITLGVLTAIGGMIDIGNLVANPQAGARFGLALAWVIVLGVVGIMLFTEMASRVATVSQHPIFDVVRERLGARMALANLFASAGLGILTLIAEIGGLGLLFQLVTGFNYLAFIPPIAVAIWVVVWRLPFQAMERIYGLLGLGMLAVVVAVWQLHPDWSGLMHEALHPTVPPTESHTTYWYFAIAQLGSVLSPYQIFFFTSGAVEERWKKQDLLLARSNIFLGFGLGTFVALGLMVGGAMILRPISINPEHLGQSLLPVAVALGRTGLIVTYVGVFAAVFGASLECSLAVGYTIAQYFGWEWGKMVKPAEASRFHLVVLAAVIAAAGAALTTIDPIKVTGYALILGAASIPLTYFPTLVVANDPDYMGDKTNSRATNALATAYLAMLCVVSVAALPLLVITKAGA
jgi:Mn2+/Fe2+ NRAMP family transporter